MTVRDESCPLDQAGVSEEEIPALVLRAQARDPDAFTRLFHTLRDRLHRHALFLAGDPHQALDLLQETMIETWQHLPRYDGRTRLLTWACRIMLHRHYDWLRRLRVRAFILFSNPPDDTLPASSTSQAGLDPDHARIIRECLDRLPAKQRLVVYLRFYVGESLVGIAAAAHCSLGTVKSRLFHGLARLAKMKEVQHLQEDLLNL
jgi:RNA polymerase sigma-70 factor (ECF subfamily)